MSWFGEDFKRAGKTWLYPTITQQHFWPAFGLSIFIFSLFSLLQVVFGFAVGLLAFHVPLADLQSGTSPQFMQSIVIGVFPAACLVLPLLIYLSRFGMPDSLGRLPLAWPKMGVLGWALTLGLFVVFMYAVIFAIYAASGLDPIANQGAVEKAMANMSLQKWQFIWVLPSLVLGAAFIEELLFRGILFAGIKQTKLGATGAVIITAAVWASAHAGGAPPIAIAMLFIMGLLLGVMLLRFGTLWVTIIAHGLWNGLTSYFIFTQVP